ncbi:MAG: phosphate ABC transporter permease subunit PstC [Flavobacteriales bacterium CG_4_8_14_3_um_filter_35_10]|nr:phosphate ABC transporter permease subunit PstC [Zetaproteobacteria bacterium]NDK17724.1 phosphate ABC transporter permease subunit PstC [Flavobacteriales bacterium]OIO11772.1 MAG: phosphate ABC transporter permease subunit PstC [Flavobacteriaceae bacterium CG1_02_35_72]PIR14807.1 MAG: phosphate ABC transporter permease subunit PstC [Flavobacteriales bacterium CG11_big_fil_rev_8_21_14_0_20_35_7]PIX06979.1 MAG: phosphate ABC transporter permease subunit PstC [Flavobacteriales bacterium CG_4_8
MPKIRELIIEKSLLSSALITIAVTVGIILVLTIETFSFFKEVSIFDFFTDIEWTPLFTQKHYGILPLLTGTLLTTFIAISVALPIGLSISIYLSEYAPRSFRKTIKPLLELLAAVPSVVYGFFALVVVTPYLQQFIPNLSGFNSLSAGIVMGIMIIPFVSSLSEDALFAVPKALREASYGMGATRLQTAFKVVVPAASSGIIVSIILAISRAIGETMIVAIAAGQQPRLTLDPTVPVETITAYIVQVSLGDVQHGSLEYRTIFAAGITLFIFTFLLNTVSFRIRKKYREKYE